MEDFMVIAIPLAIFAIGAIFITKNTQYNLQCDNDSRALNSDELGEYISFDPMTGDLLLKARGPIFKKVFRIEKSYNVDYWHEQEGYQINVTTIGAATTVTGHKTGGDQAQLNRE